MKNWNVAIGVCVGAVLGFAVDRALIEKGIGAPNQPNAANALGDAARRDLAAAAKPPEGQAMKVLLGGSQQKGPDTAKVTMVEFSDFQCPYCGRGNATVQELEKQYGDDLRVVFKHNPLPMHPDAPFAAKAAIAAGRQGKFWEMHDKLFAANLKGSNSELSRVKVEAMAHDIPGLDFERWKTDADSNTAQEEINSDQAQARQLGANGTPHFFINGVRISGAQPAENFKAIIDAQLKRANELLSKGVSKKDLYAEMVKDGATAPPPPPPQRPAPPPPAQVRKVDPGQGPSRGARHPKVTIVEWSDFQCPFCSRAEPTVDRILQEYKDDVKVVWRNEPLSMHPQAMPAAKAAMAAHKQGKFWEMHNKLFEHQRELADGVYERWAQELGLDLAKFKQDMESPEIAQAITADSSYGQQVGADGTPTFFINGRVVAGALPFESFKPMIDEQIKKADELLKKGTSKDQLYDAIVAENIRSAPATPSAGGSDERVKVEVGSSPVLGAKNAPVTIAIWSDFQCPYCSRIEPTFKQVREAYGNKVKMVWKNQPLGMHPMAMPAAEAAMAAGEQGKFWEMHDKLFENQNQLSPELFNKLAGDLGLNLARFKSAIESHKYQAQIQADMTAGSAVGANGTPTSFINGKKLIGAQPFDAFKLVIDAELASAVAKK